MDMIVPALLVLLVGLVGWLLVRKPAATSDAGSAGRAEALQAQLDALLQEKRGLIDEKQALAQDKTRLEVQVQVAQEARAEAVAKAEEATGKAQAFERAGLQTQGEIQRLNTELSLIAKQVAEKGAEAQKLLEAGQALRQEHNQLQQAHALLQGQHQSLLQEKADRTIALKNEIEQLQEQFKNSVNELMDVKSRALKEDNKDSVNQLMEPLRQKMTEFSTRVEDLNKQSAEQHGSLKQELGNIQQLNQALTQEAHNLAQALRGDAKVMGDWGEHTLELVLESSGLQKGIHYTTQEVLRGDEGVVRTDITLHLPQGRNVVIDSKVSIKSYVDYCSAAEPDRPQAARALLNSLDAHIKKLATTEYHRIKEGSVEFTFMFVPQDPVFSLAVQLDPDLVSKAYKQRVMLVTPSTLLVALKVVSDLWQREEITKSHKELVALAANIYHKLTDGLGALEDVGKQIGKAREAYDTAFNLIVDGKGNVIRSAENIRKIAARDVKQAKRLDKNAPSFYQQGLLNAEYDDHTLELPEPAEMDQEDSES